MTRSALQDLIDTVASGQPNTAEKIREVFSALADSAFQTGDIKEIDVPTSYIAANFDSTGLGTNERLGWKICNGQNGTKNRGGRTSVGYDPDNLPFNDLGNTGGEEKHTLTTPELPSHSHNLKHLNRNLGPTSTGSEWILDNSGVATDTAVTNNAGGGLAHNNMQPYIVSLFIQKI